MINPWLCLIKGRLRIQHRVCHRFAYQSKGEPKLFARRALEKEILGLLFTEYLPSLDALSKNPRRGSIDSWSPLPR